MPDPNRLAIRTTENRPATKVVGLARVKGTSLGEKNGNVLFDLAGVGHDDDEGEKKTETRDGQASYATVGGVMRPRTKEEDGELAECVTVRLGDESLPVACKDPRVLKWVNKGAGPTLPRASETLYPGQGGAFLSFHTRETANGPEDDVTLRVPYARGSNGAPTKSDVVFVGAQPDGKRLIDIRMGDGLAITYLDGVLTLSTPGGEVSLSVSNDGTSLLGPLKAFGGCDLGGPTTVALAKFAPIAQALTQITSVLAAIAGACGPGPLAPIAAAMGTPMTALGATLTSLPATGPTVNLKGQ